ncbi:uncharacterized protein [Haliotis asinina]|uniref:uncharacterized protein n=1 Tax=Haliotis asinina TaxID=109174 RepID=UPI0035319602
MFVVWPTLLILILMIMLLMGLVTLGHVVTARHPRCHLCTLIPISTVCVVGIIHVLHYVALLTLASNDPDAEVLKARLQWDYTSIDIVVLAFLWRFCAMSSLTTVQTMKAFVYFVLAAVGRVTMKSIFPQNQLLGVVLQQHNGLFKYPLMKTFLCGLSVEYFLFYLPAFITMCMFYYRRSVQSPNETCAQNEDPTTGPEVKFHHDMCNKCETMSPLLDMVAACMALLLLLVRPFYILSCYLVHGIPMDMITTYCLFPFYFAVCSVNINVKGDRSQNPHSTVPPVLSREVPNIYVK